MLARIIHHDSVPDDLPRTFEVAFFEGCPGLQAVIDVPKACVIVPGDATGMRMDHSTAYNLIVEYLSQRFGVPLEKIQPDSKMFEDLGLDSIDALDMLALLDRQYRVKVNEEQARRIRTVEDAVQYVLANLPESAPQP
jgi:acyl carrier protein